MTSKNNTPILDQVKEPHDLRNFTVDQLKELAKELRQETIDAVSVTGGHLGAGLGVVELTVAIHHVFDTPEDKLIWDVGHQAYPHKILHRPARPHSHAAPRGRALGLHPPCRERLRPLRRRAQLDVDLVRPRHGGGTRPHGEAFQRRERDRRWGHERWHGL